MTEPEDHDVNRTLEAAALSYRSRYSLDDGRRVEVVVPSWWVSRYGEERIATSAARLNIKITTVESEESDQGKVKVLVFEEGTWHCEPGPTLKLDGTDE